MTKKSNELSISGLKRELQELTVLLEIASSVNASLSLEKMMHNIMSILHKNMAMERGTLTLLDTKSNELFIELAYGLGKEEIRRGRYQVGEGVTGRVVEAGEPIVVRDVGDEPLFLNRTGARRDLQKSNISFICVPIKLDEVTIGALSVDCLFRDDVSLEEDLRILTIIGSMFSQAVRIHQLVQREKETLQNENKRLRQELKTKFRPNNIIGESKRMADVYASIDLVSQTPATVLLRGESGTGKELVAHAIHYASDRADKPFIKVSCAALPDNLLEAELFGHEKGAFTGATARKLGRFELANEGTLFLDEIGDVSANTQIKLLRVLQEKEFERVGGTETIRVKIRLIAATNRDLEKMVREGKFREDLYYRLNVVPIFLPPLRERKEDIPLLVNDFLKKINEENGKGVKYISEDAMSYLMNYSWPGNVRELENAITRAVILCQKDTLSPDLFPIPGDKDNPVLHDFNPPDPISSLESHVMPTASNEGAPLTEQVENLEKKLIADVLQKTRGSQRKAAKILGVTERILGYKIKKYGVQSK